MKTRGGIMRTRKAMTISLPPAMARQMERARRLEHRTRSELVREALRTYFDRRFPVVPATQSELAAIRRGRREIQAGNYVTWEELIHELESPNRKTRKKSPRKAAAA